MDERVKEMAEQWWFNTGSGIVPDPTHDMEEHASRVCAEAFAAGYAVAQAPITDTDFRMMTEAENNEPETD